MLELFESPQSKPAFSPRQARENCEQRRAEFIRLLDESEHMMRCALEKLPRGDKLHERLAFCSRFIARQKLAQNPDTFLACRLLSSYRRLLQYLACSASGLTNIQLLHQGKGQIPSALRHLDLESLHRLSTTHQLILRLRYALGIGSAIGVLHHQLIDGIRLHLAEAELAIILNPDASLTPYEHYLQRELECEARRAGEEALATRYTRGYVSMARVRYGDSLALTHPAGAITFSSEHGSAYDIDLSLLTDDESAFPNPEHSACTVFYPSGVYGCTYTDRKDRRREVRYDREIDGLILST